MDLVPGEAWASCFPCLLIRTDYLKRLVGFAAVCPSVTTVAALNTELPSCTLAGARIAL
jgi:hypothetical protein